MGLFKKKEKAAQMKPGGRFQTPDSFVIAFILLMVVFFLTFIIPVGSFTVNEETYMSNGVEKTRQIVDPESFKYETNKDGEKMSIHAKLFSNYYEDEDTGFINAMYDGFVNGGYDGNVGIIAFILIIGGAFSIIIKTGAIDGAVMTLASVFKDKDIYLIPILQIVFACSGGFLGLAEETIPFGIVLIPLLCNMGFDSITGLLVVYVANMVGMSTSWMDPFILLVAQGIAGVPALSGATLRIITWAIAEIGLIIFTFIRAKRIRQNPESSFMYESDNKMFRSGHTVNADEVVNTEFNLGHKLILLTLAGGIAWLIWGVMKRGYYIPQMAAQLLATAVVIGILGVIFKCNDMRINDIAKSFKEGASNLAACAMIIALAKGITLVMGGTDASAPSMINTIIHGMGTVLQHVPASLSAAGMFIMNCLINILIPSGPAQAGLVMPIQAPLGDIIGVSRQTSVFAFKLGDGFTNMITPLSGVLMAFLGIANVDFAKWLKFIIKIYACLFILGIVTCIIAVNIGY